MLAVLCVSGAYSQGSAACLAQVTSSSSGNKCAGNCNGTALCSPVAGTAPYTYLWSPGSYTTQGITALCAGNYTVMVTDFTGATCSNVATITEPASIVAAVTTTSVTCNGGNNGSASVSASGGSGFYTYSWAPVGGSGATANGLVAGNYTITVTDGNGCAKTNTGNVAQPPALIVMANSSGSSATANASGGVSPYNYMWSPGGQTTQTATSLANGTYTVTVTDANGCSNTATTAITVGIMEAGIGLINIYPNPSRGEFILEIGELKNEGEAMLFITNDLGERVVEEQVFLHRNTKKAMDLSGFAKGVYFIFISKPEGDMKWKLMKE